MAPPTQNSSIEVSVLRSVELVPAGIQSILPTDEVNVALVAFSDQGVHWRDPDGWQELLLPQPAGKILCCATVAGTLFVGTNLGQLWFVDKNRQAHWQTISVTDEAIITINVNIANNELAVISQAGHIFHINPIDGTPRLILKLPFAPTADAGVSWSLPKEPSISLIDTATVAKPQATTTPTMVEVPAPPALKHGETTAVEAPLAEKLAAPVAISEASVTIQKPTKKKRRKNNKSPKTKAVPPTKSATPSLAPLPEITLSLQATISAHSGWLNGILVFPERDIVLTAGADGWLRRWQLSDLSLQQSWLAHVGGVTALVEFDEGTVATAGNDCHVRVWATESGAEQKTLATGPAKPTALCPVSAENLLIVADEEGYISWWELQEGSQLHRHRCHERMINDIGLTDSGKSLFTVSNDKEIHRYSWPAMEQSGNFVGHDDWVNVLVASRDGQMLFTGSDDNSIRSWDISEIALHQELKGHQGWIRHLALSADEKWLLSTAFDGKLLVWDTDSGRMVGEIEFSDAVGVIALEGVERLLVGDSEGRLHQIQWSFHEIAKQRE